MSYSNLSVKSLIVGLGILFCCFSSVALSQTKPATNKILYVACDRDSCGFAVQDTSVKGLKWYSAFHASLQHKMTSEEQENHFIVKKGPYKPQDRDAKFIGCTGNDGFVIWSNYDEVLTWIIKDHTRIMHGKEMTDAEAKNLITTNHK